MLVTVWKMGAWRRILVTAMFLAIRQFWFTLAVFTKLCGRIGFEKNQAATLGTAKDVFALVTCKYFCKSTYRNTQSVYDQMIVIPKRRIITCRI